MKIAAADGVKNDHPPFTSSTQTLTLWLFNSSPWKDPPIPPIFKFGKPSISMDHNNHGYVSHNKMVVQSFSQQQTPKKPGQVLSRYYLEPGDPRSRFTGPIEHSYFGENQ